MEIKNKDSANLFNLYQEERKKSETGDRALQMILDMETAYPQELSALLSKSRQKKSPPVPSNKKNNGNTK